MYIQGDFIDEVFCLSTITQGYTNNQGKPYLNVALVNKTGNLDGRYWDMELSGLQVAQGDYARVQGTVKVFNGAVQLNITHLHKVAPVNMVRESRQSLEDLSVRLKVLMDQVPHDSLSGELLERFGSDVGLLEAYCEAPAATSMHHNYKRGLLEHSVSVAEIVSTRLPEDESGIGIAAALLHDIGKIDTYSLAGPAVIMTEAGKMLGHIVLGVMKLQPLLEGFPEEFKIVFLNAIVGHHGKLEWGSPELPKTRFGWLIHQADLLDSYSQHIADMPEWEGWVAGDKMLRTEMFKF